MNKGVFLTALLVALAPSLVYAQSAPDKAAQLLQIIADQQTGGGHAVVTVGSLGKNLPNVPLPKADIIGTIQGDATGQLRTLVGSTFTLYYGASREQAKAYATTLTAAGWKQSSILGHGGFVSNDPTDVAIYCRPDESTITTRAGEEPSRYLQITISSGSASNVLCKAGNAMNMLKALSPSLDAPLPTLHVPAGSKMESTLPTAALGRTSARITSTADAQTLLDDFARQFIAGGWTAGSKAGVSGIAFQTFTRVDNKHTWECAMTIYAEDGKPGSYFASIVPTDLTVAK
jgi:hypothetical protein